MSRRVAVGLGTCVVMAGVVAVRAEIVVEDHFPGYAEDPGWLSWDRGVGDTTYDANAPGFAHLNLDGPASGVGDTYHNAEIYHYGAKYRTPPYCDFEVRLRNSNNNGWDSPNGPNDPDPNYGIGSRGWGFWNQSMDPISTPMTNIWFVSMSPQSTAGLSGTRLWVIKDNVPYAMQELGIDLTEWHVYRIKWRSDHAAAYIDDMATPIWETDVASNIPDIGLTFTVWCDNYQVTMTGTFPDIDLDIDYLDVPDIQQYIDVDYVKIYTEEYTLTLDYVNGAWGGVQVEPNYPTYAEGTEVTLTAQADDGKSFRQWEVYDPNHPGDANYAVADTNNPLAIVMDADREVTASFKCGGSAVLFPLAAAAVLAGFVLARRASPSAGDNPV